MDSPNFLATHCQILQGKFPENYLEGHDDLNRNKPNQYANKLNNKDGRKSV